MEAALVSSRMLVLAAIDRRQLAAVLDLDSYELAAFDEEDAAGLAGVLYDQGKFAEAKTAYDKVRDSDLAKVEPDAKGRAIEGAEPADEVLTFEGESVRLSIWFIDYSGPIENRCPEEHDDVRWVSLDAATELDLADAIYIPLLRRALRA